MEKYYNENGDVGVLYSPGYGAGWSTLAGADSEFFLFDKTLVEFALDNASVSTVESYLKHVGKDTYLGGWNDIKVKFMKPGTAFLVEEYDGNESIAYYDQVIPYIA